MGIDQQRQQDGLTVIDEFRLRVCLVQLGELANRRNPAIQIEERPTLYRRGVSRKQ